MVDKYNNPQIFCVLCLVYLMLLSLFSHLMSVLRSAYYASPTPVRNLDGKSTTTPAHPSIFADPENLITRFKSTHPNESEIFSFIVAAILLSVVTEVDYSVIEKYCATLVALRTASEILYMLDFDIPRLLCNQMILGNVAMLMGNACFGSNNFESFLDSIKPSNTFISSYFKV